MKKIIKMNPNITQAFAITVFIFLGLTKAINIEKFYL